MPIGSFISGSEYKRIADLYANIVDSIALRDTNLFSAVESIIGIETDDGEVKTELLRDFQKTYLDHFDQSETALFAAVRSINQNVLNRSEYSSLDEYILAEGITVTQQWADLCDAVGFPITFASRGEGDSDDTIGYIREYSDISAGATAAYKARSSVSASASTTSVIRNTRKVTGSIAAVSSITTALGSVHVYVIIINGTSTATASIKVTRKVIGTSTSTSTATSITKATRKVIGTIAVISTTTNAIPKITRKITGTITSNSVTTGVCKTSKKVTGNIIATTTITGSVGARVIGDSTVFATAKTTKKVTVSVSADSSTNAHPFSLPPLNELVLQYKLPNFFIINGQQRPTNINHDVWKLPNVFPNLSVDSRFRLSAGGSTLAGSLTSSPSVTASDYGNEVQWLKDNFGPIFTGVDKNFRYSMELRAIGRWWENPVCTYFMQHPLDKISGALPECSLRIFTKNGRNDTKNNWSNVFYPALDTYLDNNNLPDPYIWINDIENTSDPAGYPNEAFRADLKGWFEKALLDARATDGTDLLDGTRTLQQYFSTATDIVGNPLDPFNPVTMGGNNYPQNTDYREMAIDAWHLAYQYAIYYSIVQPAKAYFPNTQGGEWDVRAYNKTYPFIERPLQYHYLNNGVNLPDIQMPYWYGLLPVIYTGSEPVLGWWPSSSWPTAANFESAYGSLIFEDTIGSAGTDLGTWYDAGNAYDRASLFIAKRNVYSAARSCIAKRIAPGIALDLATSRPSINTMINFLVFCWLLGAENFYVFCSSWDSVSSVANDWNTIITTFNDQLRSDYGIIDVIITPTPPIEPI